MRSISLPAQPLQPVCTLHNGRKKIYVRKKEQALRSPGNGTRKPSSLLSLRSIELAKVSKKVSYFFRVGLFLFYFFRSSVFFLA